MKLTVLGIAIMTAWAITMMDAAAPGISSWADQKPHRVLVVIGNQWGDPGSYLIHETSHPRRKIRSPVSAKDFVDVVTMLKIWGIPFDILRLDEQRLQINRFLNGVAEPNYACVIWMADPDTLTGYSAHYPTLRRVVEEYGISLIALFDTIGTPEVADLVGVKFEGRDESSKGGVAALRITADHFITEGMTGATLTAEGASPPRVVRCRPLPGTQVLGELRGQPQFVVREVNASAMAVWIGGGQDWFDRVPAMRTLFRKALVHCMGYGVFNDSFENAFMFILDDMGTSEHAYSLNWHYPTPSREAIVKCLIEPLAKRNLVMIQNVSPGYANPESRMIENPWTVPPFTDPFGNWQDFPSTKAGLDEGVRRGVFEIHAHRMWSHLNWDLDSPPGPWWDAPIEGERADGRWYHENFDFRRGVSCPPNDILFTYRTGRDAIQRQFGVTPLAANAQPGEDLEHDDRRLAVIAGYGVDRMQYLGRDRVVQFSIPAMTPQQEGCHDIDLLPRTDAELTGDARGGKSPEVLRGTRVVGLRADVDLHDPNWPDRWKDKRWIGFNEYCAYLHSSIESAAPGALSFDINYDDHYCQHFARHPSRWTLELAPRQLKRLGSGARIWVDGRAEPGPPSDRTVIAIPPGTGRHRLEVRAGTAEK